MSATIEQIIKHSDLFEHIADVTPDLLNSPFYSVSITKDRGQIILFIGPPDPYKGGSGISIYLNIDYSYITHNTETLDPVPDAFIDE